MIVDSLAPVSIRPKEINVYEKFTQTDATMETMGDGQDEEIEEETSVVAEAKEPELKQEDRQEDGKGHACMVGGRGGGEGRRGYCSVVGDI